jgi:predicted acetyltransferase
MTIEFRPPAADELRQAGRTVSMALMFPPYDDALWEQRRSTWEETTSIAAFDGAECVGHAGQFIVDTHVPGGARLATGAVTRVGVMPTHRRRGVATGLMHGLIERSAQDGLVLMSLRASEAVIYRRFGFGVAGDYASVRIDPVRARPVRGATTAGSFRVLSGSEVLATAAPVYERFAHTRPGTISRPESFHRRYMEHAIKEDKPSFVVVHTGDTGEVDGYAHYSVAWNEDPDGHGGKGEIHDVIAADAGVELALWQYLMAIDLVRSWSADERPLDDLARDAFTDRRAYEIKSIDDEQWLRLVDADAALRGRTYNAAHGSVTIAVTDPVLPNNSAAWSVSAEGAVRCDDGAAPDLTAEIGAVSAAYLGGTSWQRLALIGEVTEHTPGTAAIADALFASRPLPYCGSFF